MAKKINYLNNKDLLTEIQKSKDSYSSYRSPEDRQYDIIVTSLDQINSETIASAQVARAKRISTANYETAKEADPKAKLADFEIDPLSIPVFDLVFRVMTWDHIPKAPGRKKTPKSVADHHAKVNFPPYQHWRYAGPANELICVGKSHWKGELDTGAFSVDHGQFTDKFARMIIRLCERYATRGNVRGYTYNDEMKGQAILQLTQVGLQFDESKSEIPFAYLTQTVINSFIRVINTEKRMQTIRDDILEMNGMNPSMTRIVNNEFEAAMKREQLK